MTPFSSGQVVTFITFIWESSFYSNEIMTNLVSGVCVTSPHLNEPGATRVAAVRLLS